MTPSSKPERAAEIAAISVAGQQHGLVVLDAAGRPVRPAKLWNDTESAEDALRMVADFGGAAWWAERIGLVPVASFTATKWAWLRRVEPRSAAATRAIRLPHDFLTERLTGAGVTDRGDASGTAWWSTATESYADEVLAHPSLRLDPAMLPRVLGPGRAGGRGDAEGRPGYLGLRAGIPVGPGTGDNAGAAVGLGLAPGSPVISLGTSGTAFMSSGTRTVDPSGSVAGFADATGRFLPLAATLNCTLAVDRIAAWLGLDRDAAAERTDVGRAALPGRRAEPEPPQCRRVDHRAAPRHRARRDPAGRLPGSRPVAARSPRGHRHPQLRHRPRCPRHPDRGRGAGATWRRVVRALSGRPIQIPEATELVALGGAAQAAAVLGGGAPEEIARRWDTRGGDAPRSGRPRHATLERIRDVRTRLAELNA